MTRLLALASAACLLLAGVGLPQARAAGMQAACTGEALCQQRFVRIGGIEQWISIAGANPANPVLLMVHGGPGIPQWPDAAHFEPWEKYFTVVLWDQRGAGHTFGRYGAGTPDVTLQRIADDGVELTRYLCRTLGKKKIVLLGHSWGSLVAVHMVQQAPQLFAAYVGTGQMADFRAGALIQYRLILDKARRNHAAAELKALQALGDPDPANQQQYAVYRNYLPTILAPSDLAYIKEQRSGAAALMAAYPKEGPDVMAGAKFSHPRLWPYVVQADLPRTAATLGTAYFLIQGQGDVMAATPQAVRYFEVVQAPYKKLVVIPHAGHFALITAPDAFRDVLVKKVRPVAIARGA
ncbi:MAG TPA: alpha/beta hydrolase [Steroidobacteraceae bacterium]|jgi:pimeloyl-ACP methyl ester carboxylesterase|nr:alpha/beta hydrolase [Steroidobacteraceae bacterium]